MYFDGHKCPDVVKVRKNYMQDHTSFCKCSWMYNNEGFETSIVADPDIFGENKETVSIFHNKSTIHAKEKSKLAWLLPGTSTIQSKNAG